jgi:hypothetical protein
MQCTHNDYSPSQIFLPMDAFCYLEDDEEINVMDIIDPRD